MTVQRPLSQYPSFLCPSPNFDARPVEGQVKYLILHYTGMKTGKEALDRLCDEASKVSAHYLIEEDGRVFSLVPEDKRAWHAGLSAWEGDRDINGLSIGIELVNPGHDSPNYKGDYRAFPDVQMLSLMGLCKDILARHDIKPWHVLGHSDVAPDRKCDPGELFDWQRLAAEGIGAWPSLGQSPIEDHFDPMIFQKRLKDYGYQVGNADASVPNSAAPNSAVRAFQQHFRPADIGGIADRQCLVLLGKLLEKKQTTT